MRTGKSVGGSARDVFWFRVHLAFAMGSLFGMCRVCVFYGHLVNIITRYNSCVCLHARRFITLVDSVPNALSRSL